MHDKNEDKKFYITVKISFKSLLFSTVLPRAMVELFAKTINNV